jgi:carboxylesterase type B
MEWRTAHGNEIPYVFGTLRSFPGRVEEVDEALARAMSSAWYRFAAKGDPNGDGLPAWPRYDRKAEGYLEIGDKIVSGRGLQVSQCEAIGFVGHTSGIPGGNF